MMLSLCHYHGHRKPTNQPNNLPTMPTTHCGVIVNFATINKCHKWRRCCNGRNRNGSWQPKCIVTYRTSCWYGTRRWWRLQLRSMGIPKTSIEILQHIGRRRLWASLALRGNRHGWWVLTYIKVFYSKMYECSNEFMNTWANRLRRNLCMGIWIWMWISLQIYASLRNLLLSGSGDVTTVAVKTLKESAAEVEKKDLLSELEVSQT